MAETGSATTAATSGGNGAAGEAITAPWGADAASPWTIGEGDAAKPWYDFLPEGDVRTTIAAKKPANPVALAQSYYELQRSASHANDANTLIIPSEGATEKDWNAFWGKWGRPDDVSGYNDIKWGEGADPKLTDFAKNLSYELGLNTEQAQRLADKWGGFIGELNQGSESTDAEANARAVNALKADWKGDWNADLAAGNRVLEALKQHGVTEEDLQGVESHVGLAPVVKILAMIGRLSGENFVAATGGQQGSDPSTMSPEQATAEVAKLNGDEEFQKAYLNAKHANHQAAVERMSQLYAKAGSKLQI